MLNLKLKYILVFLLSCCCLNADSATSPYKFEGIIGEASDDINNMHHYVGYFIPYNPVIVEIGAFEGRGTASLANTYQYGSVFAFEPNPKAYSLLEQNTRGYDNVEIFNSAVNISNGYVNLWGDNQNASLLKLESNSTPTVVPCIMLDTWGTEKGIDHIDFLRLDAGGLELQILKSSPKILKTLFVIVTKTHLSDANPSLSKFAALRSFLESQDFEMFCHWYEEGKTGEAMFVRKYMFDSLFR